MTGNVTRAQQNGLLILERALYEAAQTQRCSTARAPTRRGPHLWAASTGLPGLRCASMPFADEVIFNFGPGVAAGGFRALGALLGVAAVVDMEGQNNNAGCELRESSVG